MFWHFVQVEILKPISPFFLDPLLLRPHPNGFSSSIEQFFWTLFNAVATNALEDAVVWCAWVNYNEKTTTKNDERVGFPDISDSQAVLLRGI